MEPDMVHVRLRHASCGCFISFLNCHWGAILVPPTALSCLSSGIFEDTPFSFFPVALTASEADKLPLPAHWLLSGDIGSWHFCSYAWAFSAVGITCVPELAWEPVSGHRMCVRPDCVLLDFSLGANCFCEKSHAKQLSSFLFSQSQLSEARGWDRAPALPVGCKLLRMNKYICSLFKLWPATWFSCAALRAAKADDGLLIAELQPIKMLHRTRSYFCKDICCQKRILIKQKHISVLSVARRLVKAFLSQMHAKSGEMEALRYFVRDILLLNLRGTTDFAMGRKLLEALVCAFQNRAQTALIINGI